MQGLNKIVSETQIPMHELQWKKVEEASSKQSMAITANQRAADKLEDLQSKRKKLTSKK